MRKWLALALCLSGCGDNQSKPDTGVERDPVFEDVPTYRDWKFTGLCKRNAEFRSCTLESRGDGKVEEVLAFFRKAMPTQGWTSAPESGADAVTLTFTKKSEKCTITLSTDSHNKVVVKVVLGYKG